MDAKRMKEIRALVAAIAPGMWIRGQSHDGHCMVLGGPNEQYVADVQIYQTPRVMGLYDEPRREANAQFIISSPSIIIEALDEVERSHQKNANLVAMLKSLEWQGWGVDRDGETLPNSCPECHWEKMHGHDPDCALAALLRGEDAEVSE